MKSNFTKLEIGDYFSVFIYVCLLLSELEEYENGSNFMTNVNNLVQVFIDKQSRLKKKNIQQQTQILLSELFIWYWYQ